MNAIRIRQNLKLQILNLPELAPMVGKILANNRPRNPNTTPGVITGI